MLKSIESFGKNLTKAEQKEINGGYPGMRCRTNRDCWNAHPFLGPGDVSCRYSPFGNGRVCQFN